MRRRRRLKLGTAAATATFMLLALLLAGSGASWRSVSHRRHNFGAASSAATLAATTTVAPTTTLAPATTLAPTTTTAPTTSPAASPRSATPPASTAAAPPLGQCVGVPMLRGQPDIDAAPPGTAFCLSGSHNWTLTPKAGDSLAGPATLDGQDVTAHAIVALAPNVTLSNLSIQHYQNGNGSQDGAIHIADDDATKATASGWKLVNLDVGFNSAAGSGSGNGWTFTGGRFHDNGQEGIGGAMGASVTVNGTEVDHNDFTDTTYTRRNWSCGDEAGGIKWVTNGVTVMNSYIHDNACKGLWADLNGDDATITNNVVANNWDEGIFIEISSGATITGNTVTNNGWHNYNGGGSGCPWLFGGGITLNSSDHVLIRGNHLSGNCNGITGVQQDRPDGHPGLLEDVTVDGNTVSGPGLLGASEDNGANLTNRNIVFTGNAFGGGEVFCGLAC